MLNTLGIKSCLWLLLWKYCLLKHLFVQQEKETINLFHRKCNTVDLNYKDQKYKPKTSEEWHHSKSKYSRDIFLQHRSWLGKLSNVWGQYNKNLSWSQTASTGTMKPMHSICDNCQDQFYDWAYRKTSCIFISFI